MNSQAERPDIEPIDEPVAYVGSGICDFQGQPLKYNANGEPIVRSDWEQEVVIAQNEDDPKKKGIKGNVADLPRFHDDFEKLLELAANELGNNTFRTSLDFARLCPEKGVFDEGLMRKYIDIIATCYKYGLKPFLVLHHWPVPKSYCEYDKKGRIYKGAWEHPGIMEHFYFYIQNVVKFLFKEKDVLKQILGQKGLSEDQIAQIIEENGLVNTFLTINEPFNCTISPYVGGAFPPYKKGRFLKKRKVQRRLVEAHKIAYQEIYEALASDPVIATIQDQTSIGVAHNITYFEVEGRNRVSRWLAGLLKKIADRYVNWSLAEGFEDTGMTDFVGLQYYFRFKVGLTGVHPDKNGDLCEHPEFGDIYPEGIYHVIHEMNNRFSQTTKPKPIRITEFGFSDSKDINRPYWIIKTVENILEARRDGVPIDMVSVWSLFDNLEWAEGMDQRFGLYDHRGNRLESDNTTKLSSRETWKVVSQYLLNPNEDTKAEFNRIYKIARRQYEEAKSCSTTT